MPGRWTQGNPESSPAHRYARGHRRLDSSALCWVGCTWSLPRNKWIAPGVSSDGARGKPS